MDIPKRRRLLAAFRPAPASWPQASQALAPARTETAAARASLARMVRLHDRDRNAGNVGLDEGPRLKEAPARAVPADRLRNGRPATDAGQVFETDPSTHLNRILDDTFADGVVLRRLETSLLTRQPFQDRAPTSSRRPCAFRGFLLERAPNSSNGPYNHQEGRAFLPMAKAGDFARAFR